MKVYLDLVFLLNFSFDAILLFGVAIILKRKTSFKKIILASLIGALSILLLFIKINNYGLFIIKFLIAILMLILAFGYKNIKYTLKNLFYLYTISILLGGFLYLVKVEYNYSNDGLVFYSNGLSLNFIVLLISAPLIIYAYTKQIKELKNNYSNYYQINIYLKDGKTISTTAYLDTGNNLYDPYQKRPIILINSELISKDYQNMLLVPYETINNQGLLKCLIINKLEIIGHGTVNNVLLGIANQKIKIDGIDVLLHKKIMEEIK